MSLILLPGDPDFEETLGRTLPPNSGGKVCIARSGSGLLEAVDFDSQELVDYLLGGEYDVRLEEIGEDEQE